MKNIAFTFRSHIFLLFLLQNSARNKNLFAMWVNSLAKQWREKSNSLLRAGCWTRAGFSLSLSLARFIVVFRRSRNYENELGIWVEVEKLLKASREIFAFLKAISFVLSVDVWSNSSLQMHKVFRNALWLRRRADNQNEMQASRENSIAFLTCKREIAYREPMLTAGCVYYVRKYVNSLVMVKCYMRCKSSKRLAVGRDFFRFRSMYKPQFEQTDELEASVGI